MSLAKHTLNGNEDISASDTSVSMDILLDPSMAWGMNEMSACCRGLIIDCTLWAICPAGGAPWADLCQVLESCQKPQGLHLPPYHLSFLDNGDNSSFYSGCGHGPNLEVTGWKQWPLPMILLPLMEPHEHGCNVSNVIIFSGLGLRPPGWLHHILGFILNPWDNTHQRRLCVPQVSSVFL